MGWHKLEHREAHEGWANYRRYQPLQTRSNKQTDTRQARLCAKFQKRADDCLYSSCLLAWHAVTNNFAGRKKNGCMLGGSVSWVSQRGESFPASSGVAHHLLSDVVLSVRRWHLDYRLLCRYHSVDRKSAYHSCTKRCKRNTRTSPLHFYYSYYFIFLYIQHTLQCQPRFWNANMQLRLKVDD